MCNIFLFLIERTVSSLYNLLICDSINDMLLHCLLKKLEMKLNSSQLASLNPVSINNVRVCEAGLRKWDIFIEQLYLVRSRQPNLRDLNR